MFSCIMRKILEKYEISLKYFSLNIFSGALIQNRSFETGNNIHVSYA